MEQKRRNRRPVERAANFACRVVCPFPCESRGFVLIERHKSHGSNVEWTDLERINVLVHSMSIIVNQSVHNSRSNLRENGYLGSSTFVEDCVNPSRGICEASETSCGVHRHVCVQTDAS